MKKKKERKTKYMLKNKICTYALPNLCFFLEKIN